MAEGLSEGGSGSLVLSKLSGTLIYWYNVCSDLPLLSAPTVSRFQPVGRWYESRARHVRLVSGGSSAGGGVGESEAEGEEGRGDEINPLLLDPTQWKVYIYLWTMYVCHLVSIITGPGSLRTSGSRETKVAGHSTGYQKGM